MTKNSIRQARIIQQQASALHRELCLEENPEQKTYNIGILGVGDLGQRIAEDISALAQKNDFSHPIGDIYLIGMDPKKQWAVEREFGASGDYRHLEKKHTDNLEDIVHNLDIVFLAYDATPHRKKRMETEAPSRDESTLWNLALTLQLAKHFAKDFAGNVIIASNLTDTLAQAFAYRAGMDSRRVIGLNQVDNKRFKYEIIQKLQRDKLLEPGINPAQLDIRAFTAGTHNFPFGIYDGVYAQGIKITDFPERTRDYLNRILRNFGKEQVEAGISTSPSTAAAAVDTMRAIMDGQSMVTASIPFDYDNKCIYIGLPVKFQDDHAQYLEHWTRKAVLDPNFGFGVEWLQETPERLRKLIIARAINHDNTREELIEREKELLSSVDELEKAYKKFKPVILDVSIPSVIEEPTIYAAGAHQIIIKKGDDQEEPSSERDIRSSNIVSIHGKPYLALGLIRGGNDAVELRPLDDIEHQSHVFRLSDYNFKKKPGFASVDVIADKLYASHSEEGLFAWDVDDPENGEKIYDAQGVRFLQGMTIKGTHYLVFAREKGLVITPAADLSNEQVFLEDMKVTCIDCFEDNVYFGIKQGDNKGRVFRADTRNPAQEIPNVTKRRPQAIHAARIHGDISLFVASSPANLVVKNIDNNDEPTFLKYPGTNDVRDIAYAAGKVYAATGKHLLVFDMKHRKIIETIPAQHVQSINIGGNYHGR